MTRVTTLVTAEGISVSQVVTEVGSALNGKRGEFLARLRDGSVATIVVEHRNRLARLGAERLEAALSAQGRRLLVVDLAEVDDHLVRGVNEILTSLCARLRGRQAAPSVGCQGCRISATTTISRVHSRAPNSLSSARVVLRSPHMETIGIRELQQRASAAIRRVRRGETLGVTDRGQLVAVLAPPSLGVGTGNLIAAGRVSLARRAHGPLPEPATVFRSTGSVLDELRAEP